jgi:hypothetical protein
MERPFYGRPHASEPCLLFSEYGRGSLFRGLDADDHEVRDLLSDRGCELQPRRCGHARVCVRVNAHERGRESVRGCVSCRHENVRGYGCACDHGHANAHARGCLASWAPFFQ